MFSYSSVPFGNFGTPNFGTNGFGTGFNAASVPTFNAPTFGGAPTGFPGASFGQTFGQTFGQAPTLHVAQAFPGFGQGYSGRAPVAAAPVVLDVHAVTLNVSNRPATQLADNSASEGVTIFTDPAGMSPHGRVLIAICEVAGVKNYKICPINLLKGEHKTEEFKFINPHQKIPALRDGDLFLFESSAIARYLAEKYAPSLEGRCSSAAHFGATQAVIEWVRSTVLPEVYKVVFGTIAPLVRKEGVKDDAKVAEGLAGLKAALEAAEKYYFRHSPEFLIGDHLTVADISLAAYLKQLDLAPGLIDLSEYPKVFAHLQAQAQTEAFAIAHKKLNKIAPIIAAGTPIWSLEEAAPQAEADADAEEDGDEAEVPTAPVAAAKPVTPRKEEAKAATPQAKAATPRKEETKAEEKPAAASNGNTKGGKKKK